MALYECVRNLINKSTRPNYLVKIDFLQVIIVFLNHVSIKAIGSAELTQQEQIVIFVDLNLVRVHSSHKVLENACDITNPCLAENNQPY